MDSIIKELLILKANGEDSFVFKKGKVLIDICKPIKLDSIILRKSRRSISYVGIDDNLPFDINRIAESFDCYTYCQEYIKLGVLAFELLFHNQSYLEFDISHPLSEIKKIFIYQEQYKSSHPFLKIKQKQEYESYEYFPQKVSKFPFSGGGFSSERDEPLKDSLPQFDFGWSNENNSYVDNRVKKADQLIISLNENGICELASLFIDIGRDENKQDEICLEHPTLGFGGVKFNSIEAKFWLPNNIKFYCDNLDDLNFNHNKDV